MAKKAQARRRSAAARKPLFSSSPLSLLSQLSKASPSRPPARAGDFTPISLNELQPRSRPSVDLLSVAPQKPLEAAPPLPPPALSAPELALLMSRPLPKASSKPRRPGPAKASS
ncbi:MAG: hypothetical protein KGH63_04990, partial [Candidatus Micrarchaeota archaeon]|nr:hypothetical protein [Candidatus Micrarchaeota archaeon]